jgi:riboflavin kinase/FMN adenylyltransferase
MEIAGVVERGYGRGRALGCPTANLSLVPTAVRDGVYAGRAVVGDGVDARGALVVVGRSPTFSGAARRVEAHLLDFAGDLYGQRLRITLVTRLGDVRAYPSSDALTVAIRGWAAAARNALSSEEDRPWS